MEWSGADGGMRWAVRRRRGEKRKELPSSEPEREKWGKWGKVGSAILW